MKMNKALFVLLLAGTAYSTNIAYQYDFSKIGTRTVASAELSEEAKAALEKAAEITKENVEEQISKLGSDITSGAEKVVELTRKYEELKNDKKLKELKELRDKSLVEYKETYKKFNKLNADVNAFIASLDEATDAELIKTLSAKRDEAVSKLSDSSASKLEEDLKNTISMLFEEKAVDLEIKLTEMKKSQDEEAEARKEEAKKINKSLCENNKKLTDIEDSLKGIDELKKKMDKLFEPSYSRYDILTRNFGSDAGLATGMQYPSMLRPQRESMAPYLMMMIAAQTNSMAPTYNIYSPYSYNNEIYDNQFGSARDFFNRGLNSDRNYSADRFHFLDEQFSGDYVRRVPRFSRGSESGSAYFDFNNMNLPKTPSNGILI